MNKYDGIIVLNEKLTKEEENKTMENLKKCVSKINKIEDKGIRKLPYEIHRETSGHFIEFDFKNDDCKEITRQIRLDDNILKYIIIKLD